MTDIEQQSQEEDGKTMNHRTSGGEEDREARDPTQAPMFFEDPPGIKP